MNVNRALNSPLESEVPISKLIGSEHLLDQDIPRTYPITR